MRLVPANVMLGLGIACGVVIVIMVCFRRFAGRGYYLASDDSLRNESIASTG